MVDWMGFFPLFVFFFSKGMERKLVHILPHENSEEPKDRIAHVEKLLKNTHTLKATLYDKKMG